MASRASLIKWQPDTGPEIPEYLLQQELSGYLDQEMEHLYGLDIDVEPRERRFYVSVSWEKGSTFPGLEPRLREILEGQGFEEEFIDASVNWGKILNCTYTVEYTEDDSSDATFESKWDGIGI